MPTGLLEKPRALRNENVWTIDLLQLRKKELLDCYRSLSKKGKVTEEIERDILIELCAMLQWIKDDGDRSSWGGGEVIEDVEKRFCMEIIRFEGFKNIWEKKDLLERKLQENKKSPRIYYKRVGAD